MSTRVYPLYVKGNPQLRIFLPNFWMKLMKPNKPNPPNRVQFMVSIQMTKKDVKNYLEKIYKVPVVSGALPPKGDYKKAPEGYLIKDEDYRIAYVTLPEDYKFEFPDLFSGLTLKDEKEMETYEQQREDFEKKQKDATRKHLPGWFGL